MLEIVEAPKLGVSRCFTSLPCSEQPDLLGWAFWNVSVPNPWSQCVNRQAWVRLYRVYVTRGYGILQSDNMPLGRFSCGLQGNTYGRPD